MIARDESPRGRTAVASPLEVTAEVYGTLLIHSLLCPTDGSPGADKAVAFAIAVARQLSSPLTFVTVEPAPAAAEPRVWKADLLRAGEASIEPQLRQAHAAALRAGLRDVSCVTLHGADAAEAIVGYAAASRIDHVVAGSTGRAGASRLGSVAAAIVANAPCHVTIIR
jgi:nucleotide-binding universal stress UspA family protein